MRRGTIIAGLILIAAGALLLILPLFPNVSDFINIEQQWPLIIVGVGGLFILGALLGTPGLAIPGCVLGGIGLLLYYQNLFDAWHTWAYAWALIPGFVGVGIILMEFLQGHTAKGLREGGQLILISAILFLVFGAFLGGWASFGFVMAILLIGLGVWSLARAIRGGRRAKDA